MEKMKFEPTLYLDALERNLDAIEKRPGYITKRRHGIPTIWYSIIEELKQMPGERAEKMKVRILGLMK